MPLRQMKFTSNPNGKLLLPIWQDVRLRDEEKYMVGNLLEPVLNGAVLGVVKVMATKNFKYGHLTDTFSFMNCGKHAAYQADLLRRYYIHEQKMEADTILTQVVVRYEEMNMEAMEFLYKEFWDKLKAKQPDHLNIKRN